LLPSFRLEPFADHTPLQLSGGYKRRLMIARALVHRPRVLFLDEPTTGLDPQARMALWELISELRRDGLGIVLTTHYMDEAERLADRMVVLRLGQVLADDSPQTVLGDLVGEHVVVVARDRIEPCLQSWLDSEGLHLPTPILGEHHLPLSGPQLAGFATACDQVPYEVRKPTLDDLFVHLAG
jgi:lipooligosaccharide transport system ATP-binding protein